MVVGHNKFIVRRITLGATWYLGNEIGSFVLDYHRARIFSTYYNAHQGLLHAFKSLSWAHKYAASIDQFYIDELAFNLVESTQTSIINKPE